MTDEALVTKFCNKDAVQNSEANSDATIFLVKLWTGTPKF